MRQASPVASGATEPKRSLRGFVPLLVRDLLVTAVAVAALVLDARGAVSGIAASCLGVVTGTLATIVAFLLHEWGHLAGAWLSGGVAHPAPRWLSIFLFRFDVARSDRRQFLAMSYGGYAASFVAALALALWIDLDRVSGITALVLSVLGIGATLALEIPTTLRVARGGPLPTGGVYEGEPAP
ncbi:MAG: hypothetical protein AB7S26_03725 [Sandaracinaceae bacterium]